MAYWNEEQLKKMMNNTLGDEDTFTFKCKMCGNCCKRRSEPILMSGMDIFRIARELGRTPEDVLERYMRGYLGDDSHVPIFVLKEQVDGSCSLLRDKRCIVHKSKPVVCAIHPLGRLFSGEDNQIHYFTQDSVCPRGKSNGQEWTLKAWLEHFGIPETNSMSNAWFKLLTGVSTVTSKMAKEDINDQMIWLMVTGMYVAYDISKPYEEQAENNMTMLAKLFKKGYGIEMQF